MVNRFSDYVNSFMHTAHLYHAFILLSSALPDEWILGDWLINYQGGIVRRGLTGELFFRISQLSGVNVVTLIVVFQGLITLIFLIHACRLAINSSFSALTTVLIFSPAFILFPVLDSQGAFRKEILLFLLLATLCCHLVFSNRGITKSLLVLVGVASAFIILSHEMLLVYLPYVICAFIIYEKGFGVNAKRAIVAMIPATVIAIFLIYFGRGDKEVVSMICDSINSSAPQDCIYPNTMPGAVSFLGNDVSTAHNFVLNSINGDTIIAYVLTGLLSFTPLVLMVSSKQFTLIQANEKARIWLAICIFLRYLAACLCFGSLQIMGELFISM